MGEQWRRFREKLKQCDPAGLDLDGSEIMPIVVGEATRWIRLDRLVALARTMSRVDGPLTTPTPTPAPAAPPVPPGTICPTFGPVAPGWLKCDGRRVSCAEYPKLYAVVGDRFGKPDGGVTFALPTIRENLTVAKSPDTTWMIAV